MKLKLNIALVSVIIFALATAQTYLIVKLMPTEIAGQFFYVQSFIFFATSVGSSTIMIKNFTNIKRDVRVFNLFYPVFQISITLLISLCSVMFLLISSTAALSAVLFVVFSSLLNANTSITSFLRLYDQSFIVTQWIRVGMLCLKIVFLFLIASKEIFLWKLLLVILLVDALTACSLIALLLRLRKSFQINYSSLKAEKVGLAWGSLNASMRNTPRLVIFFLAERYFDAQTLVNLRLLLLPRENLASLMGVINLVFYREIFESKKHIVFLAIFSLCLVFQLGFVYVLGVAKLDVSISMQAIVFYGSASAIYGVAQQHWGIVEQNLEHLQTIISATAMAAMISTIVLSHLGYIELELLSFLTVFNLVWVILILNL